VQLLLSSGGDNYRFAGGVAKCCDTLLNYVRKVNAPHILTPTCTTTEIWLPHLHAIGVDATEHFRGILGYITLEQTDRMEGIFENISEPAPWPSTTSKINSWWSNLLTTVEEVWTDFGNTLSDIKEPSLQDSAPVATPPLTPRCSALAENPHPMDSFVCRFAPECHCFLRLRPKVAYQFLACPSSRCGLR